MRFKVAVVPAEVTELREPPQAHIAREDRPCDDAPPWRAIRNATHDGDDHPGLGWRRLLDGAAERLFAGVDRDAAAREVGELRPGAEPDDELKGPASLCGDELVPARAGDLGRID